MTEKQAIQTRHSVRAYLNKPIEREKIDILQACVDECNRQSGLNFQLVLNEPKAFNSLLARYGKFSGVSNYIAIVGKKNADDIAVGYYGEKIILKAQALGLNTCWVALTYKKIKNAFTINKGENLKMVISLGYGLNQGFARKSKTPNQVSNLSESSPKWFVDGVNFALLAPTAVNQQKFFITEKNGSVSLSAGIGFYSKVDLGIVKYHFEIGAGKENFSWSEN